MLGLDVASASVEGESWSPQEPFSHLGNGPCLGRKDYGVDWAINRQRKYGYTVHGCMTVSHFSYVHPENGEEGA